MAFVEAMKHRIQRLKSMISNYRDLSAGVSRIKQLQQPCITIFGSSLIASESPYVTQAHALAEQLAQQGFGILTGGGPGVMQSANCGASHDGHDESITLGIGVQGVDEDFHNRCTAVMHVSSFETRKHLLIAYSKGFIFLPGGVGTADELFDLLNKRKHQLVAQAPIVLIGKSFWQPLIEWYQHAMAQGYIRASFSQLLLVTDDTHVAVSYIAALARR